MRATDDRYRGEQARFELALRMIKHEARTGTIRFWTGVNDDRIRKLYSTYFKFGEIPVRRRRGRSPTRIGPLVRTPTRALESGLFANLLLANGLFSVDAPPGPSLKGNIDLGHRFCECFESYACFKGAALLLEWVKISDEHPARRRARDRVAATTARCATCSTWVAAAIRVPACR
jgi:hypothetical protein